MRIDLTTIPGAFEVRNGLPQPNWSAIAGFVDREADETACDEDQRNQAWANVAGQWLEILRASLPAEYIILESPEFYLLVARGDPAGDRLLRWCEHFRAVILDTLDGVADDEGFGKQVILAFHDQNTFYDYVCDFYPEDGEFGPAAGMFLDDGYGHIAICAASDHSLDRILAHELTHAMLRHVPLPLWLNEGITQVVEDIAVGSSYFLMTPELAKRHREYWNQETIDAFWSGDSFTFPNEGQELSYSLAQVLVRNLMMDFPRKLWGFVKAANFSDAGNQSLVDECAVSLGDRTAQFLGPGSWQPRSDYVNE